MSSKTKAALAIAMVCCLGLVAGGAKAASKKKVAGGEKMAARSGPVSQLEQAGELIVAKYVKASLPLEASSPQWTQAPAATISLIPQVSTFPMIAVPSATPEIVRSAKVRALYNDHEVAFLVEWADPEPTFTEEQPQAFKDAAALEFPLSYGPGQKIPYIGMGEKGRPVNVWHWKASWQIDADKGYQDVEHTYPNMVADDYPFSRADKGQPGGLARLPTHRHDPTYLTGWGAGSPLSDPERKTSVESLIAEGFGTLTSLGETVIQGKGAWKQGTWRVVFKRSLRAEDGRQVQFDPPQAGLVPVAFAIWDGHFDQRNGMKGLSTWYFVRFEKSVSPEAYARQLAWNPPIQGDPQEGRRWVMDLECDQCHNFPGARREKMGDVGPDLTYIGAMQRPDYLLESIKDPNATVVPYSRYLDPAHKSKMPLYDKDTLPEKGYYDIVEFLRTLK
ncbi:MAG: hypothetical protein HYY20_08955 [Candidatus Tectomicrobia bacterium]|uniref:Cytochrome c domain-containing protein n=1 Tax=Tectimicrobiota bacterium TaxID=2528274 RepID=A0A932CPZ3_UNCTE|nr:hypothetical protein [Candidatus Tectomicrobia bacterium]